MPTNKVPVVYISREGEVSQETGERLEDGNVTVKGETYLPTEWGRIHTRDWTGRKKVIRGIVVREGFPPSVPLLTTLERKWPDAKALDTFQRGQMALGLSRTARGIAGRGDLMKSLLGLPRPLLFGLLGIAAVVIYMILDPGYLQAILNQGG